ncbi:MAG: hypothetical protein IPN34_21270 [Planctomycetes bacterium]|nr:hypothetical protein [Planctomycetota bacterium]
MVLRFGFRTGKAESFAAIGRELGANRIRVQAVFRNAIQRLGAQDETRGLARYLADLNAVLSEEEPAEIASRPVPVIEEVDEVEPDKGEDAPEPTREVPVREDANAVSPEAAAVDQDEPVSERDALKLVRAADRELARAIEECVGREDLLAELQRARHRIAAGLREIELASVEKPVVVVSGKRREGRPFNVVENERRAALLTRLVAGEITNAEAAAELGIKASAWSSWKVLHRKRMAAVEAPGGADRSPERTSVRRGRGRPANVQETARRAAVLERVLAGEISNAEAATELGINLGTWGAWKSGYMKRTGIVRAPIARASVEPTSIPTRKRGRGRPVDPARLAMFERVQRGELGHDEAAAELGIKLSAWSSWQTYHTKRGDRPDVAASSAMSLSDFESFGVELRLRLRDLQALVEKRLG